jgi:hypothetical protein
MVSKTAGAFDQSLDEEGWADAYNEAGHTVAQYFLGLPFTSSKVVDQGPEKLRELRQVGLLFEPHPDQDERESKILVALAGVAAECQCFGGSVQYFSTSGNREAAIQLVQTLAASGNKAEVSDLLKHFCERTSELILHPVPWSGVRGLAQAFMKHKTLTTDEVVVTILTSIGRAAGEALTALIQGALAVRNQDKEV